MMTLSKTQGEDAPIFPELEIVGLRRISQGLPTAWLAETDTGRQLHVAYRVGELTVSVHRKVPDRPGAWVWEEVVNFHPRRMEAELEWLQGSKETVPTQQRRYELYREAEMKDIAELRAANWGGRQETDRPILSFAQLRRWLDQRSEHLVLLIRQGLAGGATDVVITAWGDGT